jgi:hypothetical protein
LFSDFNLICIGEAFNKAGEKLLIRLVGWFYGVYRHFQQYFSYFVVVSFIGGENQSTWRKSP